MLKQRIGSLFFLSLLLLGLFNFIPLVKAQANDWDLSFNSNIGVYTLPNGQTFKIRKAHWETAGTYRFNNSDCRMDGVFKPIANIINYTFSIRFYHTKYKDNAQTQLADNLQLLFRLGTYTLIGTHDKEFLTIMILDADTDSPCLQMRIETYYNPPGSGGTIESYASKQLAGGFSNNVWHTLVITYNFVTQKIYLYFDNNYWSSESLSKSGSWIWPANYNLNIEVGVWRNGPIIFQNWFSGYIDYIRWESIYTPSYTASQVALWYQFDEGDTTTSVYDISGNDITALRDATKYQHATGKFGYGISGSNISPNILPVAIPNTMPSISNKYSFSFWYKPVTLAGGSVYTTVVYTKPFKIIEQGQGAGPTSFFYKLTSEIGGSDRALTSPTLAVISNPIINTWLYFYGSYDGTTLRFSCNRNNNWTTPLFNVSASYSGTVGNQPQLYSAVQAYGFGAPANTVVSQIWDEFKLTSTIWGPYQMNTTSIGPPENITVIVPISEDYWFKGYFEPDTFYLTEDNPTGTGTLMVNSSGDFTIRLRSDSLYLLNYFDIRGCNATSWSQPASVFYTPISFILKNNTPSATYNGWINVTNSYGIPQPMSFGFTIIVSYGIIQNQTMPFGVTVMLSPLYLLWDTIKSGSVYIIIEATGGKASPICGITDERMDISVSKHNSYIDIFHENYYSEDRRDNNGFQYFTLKYAIDARLLDYGNLTIYHYVRIYTKDNPQTFTIRTIIININISKTLTLAEKLWVTVTPNSVTGKAGEIKQVTLNVYSTKIKYVYWNPSQSYDSIRPEYVFVTGENYKYTNYTVILSVRIPQSCDVPRIVTMRVFEILNPILQNYTLLTVNGIPTGADFDFSLIPLEGYLQTVNQKCIFRGYITNKVGNIDSYFLNAKLNATFLSVQVGGTANKPWYVGKDKELIFDIHVIYMELGINGTYQIQFTAYTYNASNYVSKSVLIYVSGSGLIDSGGGGGGAITGTNLTFINIGNLIPVVGLGKGAVNNMFVAFSEISGMPISLSSFLVGLIFLIIALIGTALASKGLAPTGAYVLIGLGVVVFNTIGGIWDMWILMIFVMFGILMLSLKVIGYIGGKESETK